MSEKCPVCNNTLEPQTSACPSCGFKLLGSTQRFEPVTFGDDAPPVVAEKPAAEAVLRVVRGPQTGVSIRLGEATQVIGRSPGCDVFLNDMTVSREHAIIQPCDGGYTINDANSFNGVWVNNSNVDTPQKLANNDIIQIGAFCLIYQEDEG